MSFYSKLTGYNKQLTRFFNYTKGDANTLYKIEDYCFNDPTANKDFFYINSNRFSPIRNAVGPLSNNSSIYWDYPISLDPKFYTYEDGSSSDYKEWFSLSFLWKDSVPWFDHEITQKTLNTNGYFYSFDYEGVQGWGIRRILSFLIIGPGGKAGANRTSTSQQLGGGGGGAGGACFLTLVPDRSKNIAFQWIIGTNATELGVYDYDLDTWSNLVSIPKGGDGKAYNDTAEGGTGSTPTINTTNLNTYSEDGQYKYYSVKGGNGGKGGSSSAQGGAGTGCSSLATTGFQSEFAQTHFPEIYKPSFPATTGDSAGPMPPTGGRGRSILKYEAGYGGGWDDSNGAPGQITLYF